MCRVMNETYRIRIAVYNAIDVPDKRGKRIAVEVSQEDRPARINACLSAIFGAERPLHIETLLSQLGHAMYKEHDIGLSFERLDA